MTRDDIIRRFLNLHPDTPIDGQKYDIPLHIISRMLEASAAAEREACAKVCEEAHWSLDDRNEYAAAIRARGQE